MTLGTKARTASTKASMLAWDSATLRRLLSPPGYAVQIDMGWRYLPGWPARCPGAGELGLTWRAVHEAPAKLARAWVDGAAVLADGPGAGSAIGKASAAKRVFDAASQRASLRGLRSLLRHSSLRGQAREAIAAAVAAAELDAAAEDWAAAGAGLAAEPPRYYFGVDLAVRVNTQTV